MFVFSPRCIVSVYLTWGDDGFIAFLCKVLVCPTVNRFHMFGSVSIELCQIFHAFTPMSCAMISYANNACVWGWRRGRERWYSIRWHSESNIPMQKSDLNILFWCQILLTYEYFFKLFIPTFHKIGEGQKNLLTMVGAWVTFLLYARIQ